MILTRTLTLLCILCCPPVWAATDIHLYTGARIFLDRCVLCHGNQGMGDGVMALLIDNYPSANLQYRRYGSDLQSTLESIRYGGATGRMSVYSPPWQNELSEQEIEAVAQFVMLMNKDSAAASRLLNGAAEQTDDSNAKKITGRFIYLSRCSVCHGEQGMGDGKLAGKVIRDPVPFNLTLSVQSPEYLQEIITRGGAAVGRSGSMPPWAEELTGTQVQSVIEYLLSIRADR